MTEWGIDTLFNPGKRHMDDEKRRLQATREDIGDSSGGRRIDLESGAVVIARRGAASSGTDASGDAQAGTRVDDPQPDTTEEDRPGEAREQVKKSDVTDDGQQAPDSDSAAPATPLTAYERARARRNRG